MFITQFVDIYYFSICKYHRNEHRLVYRHSPAFFDREIPLDTANSSEYLSLNILKGTLLSPGAML